MVKHSGSIHNHFVSLTKLVPWKLTWILGITFLLYSCTGQIVPEPETIPEPTVFSGNFTTEEIRGLWYVCSVSFFQQSPATPMEQVYMYCDCYTDYTRQNYKDNQELQDMTPEDGMELKQNLITECNLKIQQDLLEKINKL